MILIYNKATTRYYIDVILMPTFSYWTKDGAVVAETLLLSYPRPMKTLVSPFGNDKFLFLYVNKTLARKAGISRNFGCSILRVVRNNF